jgi:hypothetical protein
MSEAGCRPLDDFWRSLAAHASARPKGAQYAIPRTDYSVLGMVSGQRRPEKIHSVPGWQFRS